ncbi:MAG: hypothetical protein GX070_07775 [Alcaligenaceae bacterium]|nr:hypothetical protein [Alcaligenaceae bacterium]
MQAGKVFSSGSVYRHVPNDMSWSAYDQTYAMLNASKFNQRFPKNNLSFSRMLGDICAAFVWVVTIPLVFFLGALAGY